MSEEDVVWGRTCSRCGHEETEGMVADEPAVPVSKLREAIAAWDSHDMDVTMAGLVEALIAEAES